MLAHYMQLGRDEQNLAGVGVMKGFRFSQHGVLDYYPIGINLFESSRSLCYLNLYIGHHGWVSLLLGVHTAMRNFHCRIDLSDHHILQMNKL